MNVKCPYCGCSYELGADVLKNPIGNEKLGYGWWLRCYRCKRKWWLKNTAVEVAMNTPIKVDKSAKIMKMSELTRTKKQVRTKTYTKYIVLFLIIALVALCYQYRTVFYNYLYEKAKRLSENISEKITLVDVKYEVTLGSMLTVTGSILNYDERAITRVKGVKISVYDDKSLVLAWNNEFENMQVLPQQKVPFSVNKQLPGDVKDMRVEVSIF